MGVNGEWQGLVSDGIQLPDCGSLESGMHGCRVLAG